MIVIRNFFLIKKCKRSMRIEETRPGFDVFHQRYVRENKGGSALARVCQVCV